MQGRIECAVVIGCREELNLTYVFPPLVPSEHVFFGCIFDGMFFA
jgi:hypothetical protein